MDEPETANAIRDQTTQRGATLPPGEGYDQERYELEQQGMIEAWKRRVPSTAGRILGVAGRPVGWVIRTLIPSSAVEGALIAFDWVAQQTLAERQIEQHAGVGAKPKESTLRDLDTRADAFHKWQVGYAAVEGAATGATGLPGILLDIPVLLALTLRTIRGIGLCYGFIENSEEERQFALTVLAAAGANSIYEKESALLLLKELQVIIAKHTFKAMAQSAGIKGAAILTVKQLAKQLGVNLTKRKMLQTVPGIGAAVGASVNVKFIYDVGRAARYLYQERWLQEHTSLASAERSIPPAADGVAAE